MANPFQFAAGIVTAAPSSRTINVATSTAAGDTLLVAVVVNNTTCTVSGCTDSQGNVYTLDKSFTTTQPTLYMFRSPGATGGSGSGATAALSSVTPDTVTITTAAVSGNVGIYCTDAPGAGAVDQIAIANGSTTTPSISATPTANNEVCVSAFGTANGGGSPVINSPFTSLGTPLSSGSNPFTTMAYDVLTGGSGIAQTSTLTITSAAWRAGMWTFQPGSGGSSVTGVVATAALAAPAGSVSAGATVAGVAAPLALAAPAGSAGAVTTVTGVVAPLALAAPAGSAGAGATVTGVVAHLALAAPAGAASAGSTTVTVAGSWSGSFSAPGGFSFPFPSARPVQVTVANTPGDWMFALVSWRQPIAGTGVTITVADDAHNYWEPLGAPSGDSPAAGVTRTAIWYAPAARAASFVQAAATGPVLGLAVLIIDVSGLLPWFQATAITPGNAVASSLSLGIAAPSALAFVLAAAGSDNQADTISGPGGGWTSLTTVSSNNGVDHTGDIQVNSAWRVTSGSATAAWSSTGSLDFSGVTGGVLVAAPAPSQANPDWPVVVTELAPGAGFMTPPSQTTWTPLTARSLAMNVTQGRQYTLGQLQAAQGVLTIDNPDGVLIPPGSGAFAGIDSGTPVRQRMIWQGGAWQVQWTGNGATATPGTFMPFQPASPGVTYPLAMLAYCPAGWATGVFLGVNWYTSGSGFISSTSTAAIPLAAGTPALLTGSQTAPAGAAFAQVFLVAGGTPASSIQFFQAAAPSQAGALTALPGATFTSTNGATVTTLAPWAPDPRGTPNPAPFYVPFSGFFQRWPFQLDADTFRGQTAATILDAWAYGAGTLDSMLREELQLDSPYALWMLDDPAGSTAGSNLAAGNQNPLVLTTSKNGAGGATEAFGANSGGLIGDTSAQVTTSGLSGGSSGMWSQTLAGTSSQSNGYGYALVCADSNYPPVSGGVTIEAWFQLTNPVATFSAAVSGNKFTSSGTYANGTAVTLSSASGFSFPGGFSTFTVYYVISASGNTFSLANNPGGGAVTVSSAGAGFMIATTPWKSVIWSARNVLGPVVEIDVDPANGDLLLLYKPQGGTDTTVIINSALDFRSNGLTHVAVTFTQTTYRVIIDGGSFAGGSGTFSAPLAASFTEMDIGGLTSSRTGGSVQGYAWTGYSSTCVIYPAQLSQNRILNHYWAAVAGMKNEAACDRIERILEYTGLTGRRCLLQQVVPYEGDLVVSGQDIGGQPAATSITNIAASTLPSMMYVAPTGDLFYLAKLHAWNQPVKWVLGDNAAAGEIPFLPSMATDYDPSRVVNDIQLTQLDTQLVTVPSAAALEAASRTQYGDVPYQVTAYLEYDDSSAYNAGGGLNDLADWLAYAYSKPQNRIQSVTVEPASHPSAWAFAAGASVGDMVTVNLRPPTMAGVVISVTSRLTQTARSLQYSQDGVTGAIQGVLDTAPEQNCLTCDDPVRGLLNGSNVIGW